MSTPQIRSVGSSSGTVDNVGRNNLVVGETVVLSDTNAANTGHLHSWALLDRPIGSSATLLTPSSPTASFVPDVTGSYFIRCTVGGVDVRSVILAVPLPRTAARIPAFTEQTEYDGGSNTKGWHEAMTVLMRAADVTFLTIAGQIGGTPTAPDVRGIRETGGPTLLTFGAITAGQVLIRSGSTVVGITSVPAADFATTAGSASSATTATFASTAGGAPPTGPASGDLSGSYPSPVIAALAVTAAKIAVGTITDVQVAAANKDGATGTASMRTIGTGALQACAGNDSRLSDSRAPTGTAGGQLGSTYPNPDVRGVRETGGPTLLTMGAVADGKVLSRSGSTIVGVNGGHAIQDDGSVLTARGNLNFKGAVQAVDQGSGPDRIDVDLEDTAVTPGTYARATITVDQKGRLTAASGAAGFIGATGDTFIQIIPAGGRDDNDTTTHKVVGGFQFNPGDYALTGTTRVIKFRAVAAAGNTTVTGRVKLVNATDNSDVVTLTFTGTSAIQELDATLTVPTDLPNSAKVYDVEIWVDSHSGTSDTIALYSAELRLAYTVS